MKTMKKFYFLTLSILFTFLTSSMFAQFEVKLNPIGFLFNSPDLSGEYLINDEISVELVLGADYGKIAALSAFSEEDAKKSGFRVRAVGKYFFSPEKGNDRWYAGLYLGPRSRKVSQVFDDNDFGYKTTAFTAGLTGGFKWVGKSGIVFELGLGLGRAFGDSTTFNDNDNETTVDGFGLDGFGKAAVGYRF